MAREERSHAMLINQIGRTMRGGMEGSSLALLEGRHRSTGGNALRAAVLGANDGLVSNLSLVMGVAGATMDTRTVLITGLAGLLAGAISMALGEWLSVQSSRELYHHQIQVEEAENGRVAQEALAKRPAELVLSDLHMPEIDGRELLRHVRTTYPDTAVILITAVADVETAVACLAEGAMDYLAKPFHPDEVRARVQQALEKRRLILENLEYQERLEEKVAVQAQLGAAVDGQERGDRGHDAGKRVEHGERAEDRRIDAQHRRGQDEHGIEAGAIEGREAHPSASSPVAGAGPSARSAAIASSGRPS